MENNKNKKVLKIQEALRGYKDSNEAILKVSTKFVLKVKYHTLYRNLVLFKYSQRNSDFNHEIVKESRGIILDQNNNWEVVAWPYLKFFNFNESFASPIDWNTASIFEKCDGSLMTLYWYRDDWHVSSSGIPDASGPCNSGSTFRELFWKIWKNKKMAMPKVEDRDKCFMFELLSEEQIIVVRPEEEILILHGCRNISTLDEIQPQIMADKYAWPLAKKFPMTSIDEVISFSKSLDPTKAEGFVICDAQFNRVKVKTPQYVAVAHLNIRDTSGLNFGNMIKIVNENEGSEFLNYFPQYQELYKAVYSSYSKCMAALSKFIETVSSAPKSEYFNNHDETVINRDKVKKKVDAQLDHFSDDAKGTFADIVIVYFEQIRVNSEKIPKLSHIIADRDKFLIGKIAKLVKHYLTEKEIKSLKNPSAGMASTKLNKLDPTEDLSKAEKKKKSKITERALNYHAQLEEKQKREQSKKNIDFADYEYEYAYASGNSFTALAQKEEKVVPHNSGKCMSNKAKKRQGEMVYNGKGKAKNTGSSNRRNNDISLLDSAIKANQDAASESPYVRVNGKIYRK